MDGREMECQMLELSLIDHWQYHAAGHMRIWSLGQIVYANSLYLVLTY